MRKRIAIAGSTLLAMLLSMLVFAPPAAAATGFYVSGGKLYEANGAQFIMRGTSHAHTWYATQTSSFANIKAQGANSVRVVLSGGRWTANTASDVANVISLCKAAKLICVLENHDTTGYGEQSGAVTLDAAVNYWLGLQSVLTGQENYIIINIGNEPYGNNNVSGWTAATTSAIARMRTAGFDHTLMVDAPNWGQDWQFTMRDNAAAVFNSDPDRNTVFSIHMYGVFDTAPEITDYLGRFQTAGLPIVVGEFGIDHSDGNPDEDTIMAQAVSRGIGYLGWSWSGNSGGVEYLDMVTNFSATALTPWGVRIFNGANGIKATAKEATIFGGGTGDTTAPSTPGTPSASSVTSSGVSLAWAASTDAVGVTGYDVVRVQGSTETVVASPTSNAAVLTGLSASTAYTFAVYAKDAAGNRSARSGTVNVTTTGGGTGGCTAVYRVTGQWQGGFQGEVVVTNGTAASTAWTVTWTYANGQTITQIWSGTDTASGASHTVRNVSYNGSLGANASTTFGFLGTWNNSTNAVPAVTCART